MQEDIKTVIDEVVSILDPEQRIPWTEHVGKAIGEQGQRASSPRFLVLRL
jgi:hypothetical protein